MAYSQKANQQEFRSMYYWKEVREENCTCACLLDFSSLAFIIIIFLCRQKLFEDEFGFCNKTYKKRPPEVNLPSSRAAWNRKRNILFVSFIFKVGQAQILLIEEFFIVPNLRLDSFLPEKKTKFLRPHSLTNCNTRCNTLQDSIHTQYSRHQISIK